MSRSQFQETLTTLKEQSKAITLVWDSALEWQAAGKPLTKRFVTALSRAHPQFSCSWYKDLYTDGHFSIIIPVPTFHNRIILATNARSWDDLIHSCSVHDHGDILTRMEWELAHWDELSAAQARIDKVKQKITDIQQETFASLALDVHSPKHPKVRSGKSFSSSLLSSFPDFSPRPTL
jgi:hypothetical protein